MKRPRSLALALGLALFACEAQEADQQAEMAEQPAQMEEPAAVDTESIRAAIADGSQRWAAAASAGDAEALTNLYADDAVIQAPDTPRVTGRSEISAFFSQMVSEGPYVTTITTDDVMVSESGDLAVELGSFTDPEGTGKFVAVWKNVGGEWKLAIDTWNSNGSAAATTE